MSNLQNNNVPGQLVLLPNELGYSSITNLKPSIECFVWEYILSGASAQVAYLRAYPGSAGRSAQNNACRLLKTTKVQKRIAEVRAELNNRFGISAADVFRLLALTMCVDRRQFVDGNGKPLALNLLPPEAAAIVDLEIVLDKHGNRHALPVITKRGVAADSLAKIMGLNKESVSFSGSVDGVVRLDGSPPPYNAADDAAKMEILREQFKRRSAERYSQQ
jgi:hypothetical protein